MEAVLSSNMHLTSIVLVVTVLGPIKDGEIVP
jgi:hypothetical protein